MAERVAVLEDVETKPSLILDVSDGVTGRRISDGVRVQLDSSGTVIRNRSGYLIFFGLPDGNHEITVQAEECLPETATVHVPPDDLRAPVRVELKPGPTYPFAASMVLLRGGVRDGASGAPLAGAAISGMLRVTCNGGEEAETVKTRSSANGDYVLWFRPYRTARGRKIRSLTADVDVRMKGYRTVKVAGVRVAGGTCSLGLHLMDRESQRRRADA